MWPKNFLFSFSYPPINMIGLPPIALYSERRVVPERGLEPPRLAAPGPKPGAYTNFATPAY